MKHKYWHLSLLIKPLAKVSGNWVVQSMLAENVRFSQYLMGIGAGSHAHCSGEQAILSVVRRRLNPPYCIFDVGANRGQFLQLIIGNIADDELSIHCFEPGFHTFQLLRKSFGDDKRITLNNSALGKVNGKAALYYDAPGSGLASLTKRRLDHFGIDFLESETVEVDTIDNYCLNRGIDHIHLLKIDIEGHELDALAGAKRMLDNRSVDIITFEFGGCNIDTRTFFQDFWYLFNAIDMTLFRITPSGYVTPIASYEEHLEQFRTTNFIALSRNLR